MEAYGGCTGNWKLVRYIGIFIILVFVIRSLTNVELASVARVVARCLPCLGLLIWFLAENTSNVGEENIAHSLTPSSLGVLRCVRGASRFRRLLKNSYVCKIIRNLTLQHRSQPLLLCDVNPLSITVKSVYIENGCDELCLIPNVSEIPGKMTCILHFIYQTSSSVLWDIDWNLDITKFTIWRTNIGFLV